jgi:serine/threonine-protein kinase
MRLDALAAGNSDSNERLRIFQRICEPVAFAHAHGVLHRDLKPQNIMVGAFGEVLVLDWGVAKLAGVSRASSPDAPVVAQAGDVADQTQHGTRLGTPGWMAPEQERGNSADIDARTDVFALGIVLRYLLGLQPGAPRPDALVRPPARLRAIADKAAAAAREDRYDSVDALAADVRRFQDGLPVSAYPEPLYERALRIASKYRTPILLVLTYLLVRILLIFTR